MGRAVYQLRSARGKLCSMRFVQAVQLAMRASGGLRAVRRRQLAEPIPNGQRECRVFFFNLVVLIGLGDE